MSVAAMLSEEGETKRKVERDDEDGYIDSCLWM